MDLPKRATRGKRMQELIGEAKEADEEFWNQGAWQELSEDESIVSQEFDSEEKEDVEDSDFDALDEEALEREEKLIAEREEKESSRRARAKRRANVYVEPSQKKRVKVRKGLQGVPKVQKLVPASTRQLRASTKTQTKSTAAIVNASKTSRKRPVKIKASEHKLTQEELLEEAARTELENKRSLAAMLVLKEETKRKAMAKAKLITGPRLIFRSSRLGNTLTFTDSETIPKPAKAPKAKPRAKPAVCPITGLPAKYKDPLTGTPYATLGAFREIRKAHEAAKKKS